MIPVDASVLIVDDVADNRDILARRLTRFGIRVIEVATNGREALEALERRNFDLVLLDIMMPEMNGFEVLERLRESGKINDYPVVIISALSDLDPVVRCIELGAEDFVFKPFNPTLLRAKVTAILEKKALRDLTRDELKRKQIELNEARTLQRALVPPPYRGLLHGWSVHVDLVLEPAKEVGGDLVDHFRIGEHLLVLLIGDVSDKGAGAAFVMARTHALMRGLAARPDAVELFLSPSRVVGHINAALSVANATCMFVTLFLGTFDLRTGQLTYVRAGHVPPFLCRSGSALARLSAEGGLPLGLVEDATYVSSALELRPGDRLLVTTDGITEAHSPDGALFGVARVEALHMALGEEVLEPLASLTAAVREFEAGHPASDDIAAILLRLAEAPGA